MKIIKKYAMAMAALAIVATTVTLMSFETTQVKSTDELVWFYVQNNTILQDQEAPGPNATCTREQDANVCMVAFRESQLNDGHAPTNNPNDLSIQDKAYSPLKL